ncbi:MAG: hypothetical protein LQ342_005228 [Letrouitia transgressa]|nr:MAG: hypothetical protein LQ342_005228 [Letrouitia transgressa]
MKLKDFLVPAVVRHPRQLQHAPITSAAPSHTHSAPDPTGTKSRPKQYRPLSKGERDFLDSALRVNQAGELAATLIYTAQTPPIIKSHPHLRPLMRHMYTQEAGHFSTFNELLARHRIRPTAMYSIWTAAATVLGWSTALLGREAAMACTEAVETEIGSHYNGQIRVLLQYIRKAEEKGEDIGDEIRELMGTLKRIRDEELEHLDHALEEDAREAKGWPLLNSIVRGGCRGAIWISQRI